MKIKCVTACTNTNGEPDFHFCVIECSQKEYDEGLHYEEAQAFARNEGYELQMVTFDENDGPSWLFKHFVWESGTTLKIGDTIEP